MKLERLCNFISRVPKKFEAYGAYRPVPLNLKLLLQFGSSAPASKSFEFLRYELPVRIANTLQEIRFLPQKLLDTQPVQEITQIYDETFETLVKYEKLDAHRASIISEFTDEMHAITQRHSDMVARMAMGITKVKESVGFSVEEEKQLQYFLDRFYISRIGIRTLMNQHVLLYGPFLHDHESYVGCIDPVCSPLHMAISAYAYARMLCTRVHGRAPGCFIQTVNCASRDRGQQQEQLTGPELSISVDATGKPSSAPELFSQQPSCAELEIRGPDVTFCYVPGHLFHMLFELTKNAMRAVVERYPDDSTLPPLEMVICHAKEDVTIKLSDKGIGMSRNVVDKAFRYTFTTASKLPPSVNHSLDSRPPAVTPFEASPGHNESYETTDLNDLENATFSPLAGRGHGLPLSRLYAQYLSGDLTLTSVEGVGSAVCVHMKRQTDMAHELLPIFTRTAKATYAIRESVDQDWISGSSYCP